MDIQMNGEEIFVATPKRNEMADQYYCRSQKGKFRAITIDDCKC